MTDNCKFYIRARISRAKFRQILRLFALDLTASQIAKLTNLNRNTVNRYLTLGRFLIANFCELESPFSGAVECDESYFGSRHKKGKRGHGAENKHIVFGIYKRNGKVYTEIVKNVQAKTLQAIIKGKALSRRSATQPAPPDNRDQRRQTFRHRASVSVEVLPGLRTPV